MQVGLHSAELQILDLNHVIFLSTGFSLSVFPTTAGLKDEVQTTTEQRGMLPFLYVKVLTIKGNSESQFNLAFSKLRFLNFKD